MNLLTYRSVEAKNALKDFFPPYLAALTKLSSFVIVVDAGHSHVHGKLDNLRELIEERYMPHLEELESFVKEEKASGFSYLFEVVVVRLWTVLETVVGDLVAFLLQNTTEALTKEDVRKVKIPLANFIHATEDERAILLAHHLKQKVTTGTTAGVGVFENVLRAIDFGGPVHEDIKRQLIELSETRHVIVHTNGQVDRKFAERCPWLDLSVGDKVCVTEDKFYGYYYAAHWYVVELMRRRAEQDGGDTTQEVSFQEGFIEKLPQGR